MTYTLNDLVKATGTSARAIKLWEERGLLGLVERDGPRRRIYTQQQMDRAKFIAAAQVAGWSLDFTKANMLDVEKLRHALSRRSSEIADWARKLPSPKREWDL